MRAAAPAKAGADAVPASRPDPEVVAKAKRRIYAAQYKLRILLETEVVADKRGGIGALQLVPHLEYPQYHYKSHFNP
jgi:hypothetical protein